MNPFDDSTSHYQQNRLGGGGSTNPFENDDYNNIVQNYNNASRNVTNPFDSNYSNGRNRDGGGGGLTEMNENNSNNNDDEYEEDDEYNDDDFDDDDDDNYNRRGYQQRSRGFRNGTDIDDTPAEATWQYLGDLPYRRVPIYSNVTWERRGTKQIHHPKKEEEYKSNETGGGSKIESGGNKSSSAAEHTFHHSGLATYPQSAFKYHTKIVNPAEVRTLLSTTTKTIVCACPMGGPVAAITVPLLLVGGSTSSSSSSTTSTAAAGGFPTTQIHIWTNSGKLLTQIDFPPPVTTIPAKVYTAGDVVAMGFTNRTALIVVMRDSLCYVYNLQGDILIPPFFIMDTNNTNSNTNTATSPSTKTNTKVPAAAKTTTTPPTRTEIVLATIYEGGVAVLATNKDTYLVELFDTYDDVSYMQTIHHTSRIVGTMPPSSSSSLSSPSSSSSSSVNDVTILSSSLLSTSTIVHYAIITQLPTGTFAKQNYCHYCSIAVLPRTRTSSKHPEVFISTSDHTVLTIDVSTPTNIIDLNCRQRILAPIIYMSFAPNGRFLACYTESSIVTVISTSFETKVLDFDTSEGSNLEPPTTMTWCGEDRYV